MNKTKMAYFEQEDILHLEISDEPEGGSIELNPNITAELNDNGELIGIEILNASAFNPRFNFGICTSKNTFAWQSGNCLKSSQLGACYATVN